MFCEWSQIRRAVDLSELSSNRVSFVNVERETDTNAYGINSAVKTSVHEFLAVVLTGCL